MKKIFYSLFSFFIIYLLINSIQFPKNKGYILEDLKLPYKTLTSPSTVVLSTNVNIIDGNNFLYFGKISASKLTIYINDEEIYSFGSISGNLWPKAIIVKIPDKFINQNVDLKLVIFGAYDLGIHYPPILTDENSAALAYTFVKLSRNDFYMLAIGISFMLGVIMILYSLHLKKQLEKTILYIGISSLLASLMLFDFQSRPYSGSISTYIFLRKIFISSGIFALYFNIESFRSQVYKKNSKILLSTYLIVLLPFFLKNNVSYFNLYNEKILNPFLLIQTFILAFIVLKNKLKSFYFSTIFLALSTFQTIITLILNLSHELMLTYGTLIFRFGISVVFLQNIKNIIIEKETLERVSSVDPLTGIYNRYIIDKISFKKKTLKKMILIDLDNFKEINDQCGHQKGDEILKEFSKLLKEKINKNDYLIRLGGDEFAIITCIDNPRKFIENIRNESIQKLKIDFSYGISNFGNFDRAYYVADRKMYKMKLEKKKIRKL